jgi:hypothetical protein
MDRVKHICENCRHAADTPSGFLDCEYGYNTFVACQCAGTNDYFELEEGLQDERK